jgi:hypothetical protein
MVLPELEIYIKGKAFGDKNTTWFGVANLNRTQDKHQEHQQPPSHPIKQY